MLLNPLPLSKKSSLLSFAPFIGDDKLIRVGGRLSQASIPYQTKHPIVLAVHLLVKLLIQQFHLKLLHAGAHPRSVAL